MVNIIIYVALGLMLLAVILSIIRFILGPNTTDRVVSFDVMTISSLAIISIIAFLANRIIYLDIAIVYGLLSFLGVIIVAKYLEKGL